jgi:DNA modification methylase
MKPYYESGGITIYHGDCLEIMPRLPLVDLVLTDPPYGIALNTDNSRFSGGVVSSVTRRGQGLSSAGRELVGDDKQFDPGPLLKYGNGQIIWGWNHFAHALPRGTCLVWLKRYDEGFGTFLSDAEVAWMSKGHGVYCQRDMSNQKITRERAHPTQKPVSLMAWCLSFFPDAAFILDPYMGSGSTLRAAKDLGKKAIGIEIEEKYCEIAVKRLAQEVLFGA